MQVNSYRNPMKFVLSSILFLSIILGLAIPTNAIRAAVPTAVVYDAIPDQLPPNMASQPFQAQQTFEYGDYIHLAGTNRVLRTVTVTMSDWALYSDYAADIRYSGNSATWTHPITLNIYNVIPATPLNLVGSLIASATQDISIPWRPAADSSCGTAWKASDGDCYNGLAFNATFDLSNLNVTLPDDIIVSLAYNTQSWGATPMGVGGPYDSLNVGAEGTTVVGTDDNTDRSFWNTITAAWYADGGAAGVGIFREDTGWGVYGTTPFQVTAAPSPLVVYVNQSWGSVVAGEDPDGSGPANEMGYDAFTTIQAGIDAVADSGTVHVAAGTYIQPLTIDKPLALLGPNNDINPISGTRVGEAVIETNSIGNDPDGTCTALVTIEADNVSIKGFTVDGNNPALTSGTLVNGVDVDACEGIVGFVGLGSIVVENNIVKNTTYAGIDFDNYPNTAATSNNYIRYNRISNMGNVWGIGVLLYDNFYAEVSYNLIEAVRVGVQTGNFEKANPGLTAGISHNQISSWKRGIFHNLQYSNASPFTIEENLLLAVDSPLAARWDGITLSSIQSAVDAVVTDNTVSAADIHQVTVGYQVWNTPTSAALTISGGWVFGADYGIWVNDYEGYNSPSASTSVYIDSVEISHASLAGVYVQDDPRNTSDVTVWASIVNSPISTSEVGVLVSGTHASATGSCNLISTNNAGVNNTTTTVLDFEANWWGSISGPSGAGLGTGDSVSTNVDYNPWNIGTSCGLTTTGAPPVITEGTSVSVTMSEDGTPVPFDLILHVTDADVSDPHLWSVSSPAAHGTASATGLGDSKVIGYSPQHNYNGSDSFVVRVTDGFTSDYITVNVTITPEEEPILKYYFPLIFKP